MLYRRLWPGPQRLLAAGSRHALCQVGRGWPGWLWGKSLTCS